MTKHSLHILALQAAAKKQTDPVKRAKIVEKIKQIEQRFQWNKFLAQ
jgi:hypothetical protein